MKRSAPPASKRWWSKEKPSAPSASPIRRMWNETAQPRNGSRAFARASIQRTTSSRGAPAGSELRVTEIAVGSGVGENFQ